MSSLESIIPQAIMQEVITLIREVTKTETQKTLQVMDKPITRIEVIADIAETTITKYDKNNPALEIENVDGASLIKEISFSPDTNFKTKGLLKILVDEVEIYELKNVGVFQIVSIQTIKLPKGYKLRRNAKIKFLLKSTDGTSVSLAVTLTFGNA